jgi:long-chain fatty acid transport protein
MMYRRASLTSIACHAACTVAAFFFPATARAGGFHSPYQSATAAGTAFAGASARADDAGFFLYNPAAIAGLRERQTWVDARAFFPEATITPERATDGLGLDLSSDGDSGNIAARALALGSVTSIPIAPGLTLGLGSSAPFATSTETEPVWGGRFHLQRAHMVALNGQAALAWQAAPWLAVAGGVQVQRTDTKFANAALIPLPGGIVEGRLVLDGDPSWAVGAVGGLVLTPAAGTRIGLGWRSATTHAIEGEVVANIPGIPLEQTQFDLKLPQVVSAGIEQRLTADVRVFGEVQWVDWSRFDGFELSFASGRPNEHRPVEWKDTWLFAVGLGVRVGTATELTAGVSHDTAAAINGSGTTLSADAAKTTLGLGVLHDVPGLGRISVSYAHVIVHEAEVLAANPASGRLQGKLDGRMETIGASLTIPW